MAEIEREESRGTVEGLRGDQEIRDAKTRGERMRHDQSAGQRGVTRFDLLDIKRGQESLCAP